MDKKLHIGYVITSDGSIFAQVPDDNEWGFTLSCDDQQWAGGFGVAHSWEAIPDSDDRITDEDRDRLQWILDEARSGLNERQAREHVGIEKFFSWLDHTIKEPHHNDSDRSRLEWEKLFDEDVNKGWNEFEVPATITKSGKPETYNTFKREPFINPADGEWDTRIVHY